MSSKVFVALRVKATPDRVFAGFVEEIGAWWRPAVLFQTTPRAPGRLAFEAGEVEVRFEAVGEETRVSVEHRGFDRVPGDSEARHGFPDQALHMRLAEWWRDLLQALAAAAAQP